MSTNKDWQKDINLGDRTLVIFLRNGIYQFSTYSLDKQAINEEVKYDDNQLDGKWVYLSFGYKRVSKN